MMAAGESARPPWLHEGIGRLQAEQLLGNSGKNGAFLLRNSESEKGTHVLSLCCQGDIHHYHVIQSEKGYYVESWQQHEMKYFKSLEDMIHFYKDPDRGLQWPLTCPIINNDVQEEDDDSDEDNDPSEKDDNGMSSRIRFYQGSASAAKIEVADVDDEFWTWLDTYVNEGIGKDIESTQVGQPSLPDEFQRLMDLASSDLAKKMEEFMKRMTAAHEFFRQCGGSKGIHHGLDQTLKEFGSLSLINKLKNCSAMISSVDKKAVSTLRQTAIVMSPTTPFPKNDQESSPQQTQRPQPLQTFEVQAIFAGCLRQKYFLKVNVMEGQLYITKNVDEMPTPYLHSQILQLIKSRSHQLKLGIRLDGKGRKEYQFEDFKQRELFCQLVQQMHIVHNPSQEVEAITVFIGTWNMGDADPPSNIDTWLRSAGSGKPLNSSVTSVPHDVYAIGTQESTLSEKEWIWRIKNSLSSFPNVTFKQVAVQTLWGMRLVILVKEEHVNRISHVQMSTVKTGIAGVAGNKGGIGISFHFSGTSFCFINCHLTSGIEKCQRRNNNFRDILRGLQLGQTARRFGGTVDLAHQFHHLFWFGDLNYRVDLNIEKIFKHIQAKSYGQLLERDQLKLEQAQGKAFFLFKEEEINFPPTYRHQRGTRGNYEYKKFKKTGLRINVPSYCDRVLWSSFPETSISNSSYGCTDDIVTSDHSPVFATFNVGVTTQYIPASSCPSQVGTQIEIKHITAQVYTRSNPMFYLEIHSSCLEGVIRSKQNSSFASEGVVTPDCQQLCQQLAPSSAGQGHSYKLPRWTAADFDGRIPPLFPDKGYLEQQHLLFTVKSAEDDESYGGCVVPLRDLIIGRAHRFKFCLSHRGMFTGLLFGTMHLLQDNDSGHTEAIYEEFIRDDDREDEEGSLELKQDYLRRNLSVKSKRSSQHYRDVTAESRAKTLPRQPSPYSAQPANFKEEVRRRPLPRRVDASLRNSKVLEPQPPTSLGRGIEPVHSSPTSHKLQPPLPPRIESANPREVVRRRPLLPRHGRSESPFSSKDAMPQRPISFPQKNEQYQPPPLPPKYSPESCPTPPPLPLKPRSPRQRRSEAPRSSNTRQL